MICSNCQGPRIQSEGLIRAQATICNDCHNERGKAWAKANPTLRRASSVEIGIIETKKPNLLNQPKPPEKFSKLIVLLRKIESR